MSLHVHHLFTHHTILSTILYRFSLDFRNANIYASAWMDSISMEQLSSSPYALDIYGNCATSQLTQVADNTLLAHIVHERKLLQHDNNTSSTMTLLSHQAQLSMALHVASGIADVHQTSIAHNDVSLDQFLFVDGIYKISDFHLASFIKMTKEGLPCREKPQNMNLHVRPIE